MGRTHMARPGRHTLSHRRRRRSDGGACYTRCTLPCFRAAESLWHPVGPAGVPGALGLVGSLARSMNPKAVHLAQPSFSVASVVH